MVDAGRVVQDDLDYVEPETGLKQFVFFQKQVGTHDNFLLFAIIDGLPRQSLGNVSPGFDLDETIYIFVCGDDVNFGRRCPKIRDS